MTARAIAVVVACVSLGGSDCGGPPPPPRVPCAVTIDCPGTQLCLAGFCEEPSVIACASDDECPVGLVCLENGRCRADTECQIDADCCPDAANCESLCQDFACIGTECIVGEAEDCFVGCHRGARECDNGNWSLCDAPAVTAAEVCDDIIDNDCNGATDEGCAVCTAPATQECAAPCGPGTQDCQVDGTWGACDTVDGCLCTPDTDTVRTIACGACGFRDSSCGVAGFWADDELCQSEGECAAGEVEEIACGNCGQQTRTCEESCTWGTFGACTVPGDACTPDTIVIESCGACGAQTRTCDDTCQLGVASACDEDAGCFTGAQQTQPCGNCGERTSTCDDQCTFGAFGACIDEGVCSPGEVETEECGDCGTRSRTCSSACGFGVFGACLEEGECTPGTVVTEDCGPSDELGICQRGERTKECDDACSFSGFGTCDGAVFPSNDLCGNGIDEDCDGSDFQLLDQFELNDSCGTAHALGSDPNVFMQPTYDSVDDGADFFFFHGVDNFNTVSSEHILVSLTNIPSGMDLDLYLYKDFASCVSGTPLLTSDNLNNEDERVDFTEGFGGDDADYYIRVLPYFAPSCFQPYTLTVNGLN